MIQPFAFAAPIDAPLLHGVRGEHTYVVSDQVRAGAVPAAPKAVVGSVKVQATATLWTAWRNRTPESGICEPGSATR